MRVGVIYENFLANMTKIKILNLLNNAQILNIILIING